MGKTHEALMRAEEEYKKNVVVTSTGSQRALVPYQPSRDLLKPKPRWFEELKSRLESQYPEDPLQTILFTGTSQRAGASVTAYGYAECLANQYHYKVLLIGINLKNVDTEKANVVAQSNQFANIFSSYAHFNTDSGQDPNGNLYTVAFPPEVRGPAGFFNSNQFDGFLQTARESFDYVILDTQPVTEFSETRMMCSKVDGVILVLEFGKTRRQVAQKVKQELEDAGGNFLGVVINKRKYYIPKWIYKRL